MLLSPSAGNYEIRVIPATRRASASGLPIPHLQISAIALCPPGARRLERFLSGKGRGRRTDCIGKPYRKSYTADGSERSLV